MSQNEEAYLLERRCNEEIESVVRLTVAAGAKLSKDGNRWCYLLGENLQEGVAGFGESPYEAAKSFNDAYFQREYAISKFANRPSTETEAVRVLKIIAGTSIDKDCAKLARFTIGQIQGKGES